jgi:hypothetical protein
MPSNHMPLPATGAPACAVCHAAGYGVGKSIMVHSSVASESCATCHGSGKGPFAGTSQGTGGQPKQPPGTVGTSGSGNHIPVASADCGTTCHAASDAMTGTGFKVNTAPALSTAGHTAVSSLTCQTCHAAGMAWYGVTIVVPPGTVGTAGSANHIALGTGGCSTCHATNIAVGGFKITSAPSLAAAGHAAVASLSCNSCHAAASATWYGVTAVAAATSHIPMSTAVCTSCHASNFVTGGFKITTSPVLSVTAHTAVGSLTCVSCHENNATDLAFQGVGTSIYVRPGAAAAGLSPADASHATGSLAAPNDCKNCHTTTPPFQGSASSKPSNHIPSSGTCSNCHTGYAAATTGMNHGDSGVGTAGSPTACATCHGYGAGPFFGTAQGGCTTSSCTGGIPLQPPGTNGGGPSSSQHLPFGAAACSICHKSTIVPGGFKGTTVPHTNAPFMTYTRGNGNSNSGTSTPRCVTCHAPSGATWYGTSLSTKTMGSHAGSSTTADCIDCHSPTGGFAAAAAAAAKAKPRPTSGLTMRPAGSPAGAGSKTAPSSGLTKRPGSGSALLAGAGPFSHLGVAPGSCTSCHRPGGSASALPGGHLPTSLSCDACHRTTAWLPVTYAHAGVGPGHCASCHAGAGKWATPKPAAHFLTSRSCDVCHHGTSNWLPVMYDHRTPRYRPQVGFVRCVDCHTTNTEMVVPAQAKPAGRKALPGGPTRNR